MMRFTSAILAITLATGCTAARGPNPAANLDGRLARIEHDRLGGHEHGRLAATETTPIASRETKAGGGSPRFASPAIQHPAGRATNATASHSPVLTLVDFGEYAAQEDVDRPAGRGHDVISFQTARGETYERKPPLDSFFETVKRDVRDMPADLWRDTKRVYANPVNLAILGVGYGGSLALQQTGPDDTVEDHYGPGRHTFDDDWRDAFGAAGNPGTHFALAGLWYLVGQQLPDDKTYEVGKTMFSALIINGVTVLLGQAATYDRAPNGERGTFPSGHTSSSFVMASVLHEAYGHAVGIPLYGLATLVAIERVDDREHYLSDVVMGGVLGTVIGHSVASGRDPEFFGWKVLPYVSPESGASGVAFAKTFK